MARIRGLGTMITAVVAFTASCGPTPPPTQPETSSNPSVRRNSPKPTTGSSAKPASTAPTPSTAASTAASPSTAASVAPSVAPSVAASVAPSAQPSSLATTSPTLAGLGCKPAGAETPVPAAGGGSAPLVASVYGHAAVPALNVTRTSGVAIKAPPPVDVVLAAHPGSPAGRIGGYEVSFYKGEPGNTTQIGTITTVALPAIDLPAAPTTRFGNPVAVPVALPVGQLKGALADAPTAPAAITAEVRFLTESGMPIVGKDLAALTARIPLPLGATNGAAALPAADACTGASPTPFVPPPIVLGGGAAPAIVSWMQVAPSAVVRSAAGVLSQTNVSIALAAPPGSGGARIDSIEAKYEYTSAADQIAGKPPTVVGPVVTDLSTPTLVPAATASAYGAMAFLTVPFADASFAGLKGEEGVVLVTFTFKSDTGTPIPNADLNPLKVTVPVLCE